MDRRFLLLFFKKEALPSLRLSRPLSKIRTAHRRLRVAQAGGAEPLLPSLRVFTVTMKLSARNQIKGTVTAAGRTGQPCGEPATLSCARRRVPHWPRVRPVSWV